MTSPLLPPWLPDWDGAEDIAERTNTENLRRLIDELLDLVFAEDTVFLDSLPESLESALVSPLNILSEIHEGDASPTELVVASRLVRRSTIPYINDGPEELKTLIEALPE